MSWLWLPQTTDFLEHKRRIRCIVPLFRCNAKPTPISSQNCTHSFDEEFNERHIAKRIWFRLRIFEILIYRCVRSQCKYYTTNAEMAIRIVDSNWILKPCPNNHIGRIISMNRRIDPSVFIFTPFLAYVLIYRQIWKHQNDVVDGQTIKIKKQQQKNGCR